jgi:Flp pilus assembly protein TadD
MFFFLLALIAYRHYVRRPTLASYFLVLLLSAMSLMAKPMAVTLPFTLLLVDYWPLGRIRFSPKSRQGVSSTSSKSAEEESIVWLLVEKLPLFLLCAASSILTLKAQRAAGAISLQHAFAIRLENAVVSYVLYLGKAFWPIRLAALYPYPGGGWPLWAVVLSSLLLLLITALVLKLRNHHYLAWGWFWFLGTMVPMVGLVHVGNQSMADRYAYLPFIGLFVIVVWGASELAAHFHLRTRDLAATAAVFIVLLSILTYRQLGYWRDDYSLWSHTLAVTRNNFVAEDSLGEALIRRGKYYEGIAHFRTAAEIEPGDAVSQINLGIYAIQHGDLSQAAARLGHALQLTADPHLLATAYANLGSVHFSLHDYDRARRNFESALQWKATFPFIFRDLGVIAQKSGDWNNAIRSYATYAAAEPSDVAYFLLGQALEHSGDTQRANLAYAKAQEISSDITKTRKQADSLLAQ